MATTREASIEITSNATITVDTIFCVFLDLNIRLHFCTAATTETGRSASRSLWLSQMAKLLIVPYFFKKGGNIMPVILGCTIIFVFLLRYEIRKNSKNKNTVEEFLHKEFEANTTRKKDISGLPYLTADASRLPKASCPDPEGEIGAVLGQLQAMDGMQLLNLSDTSNTDLKLAYGAANFPTLSECDARYTAFTRDCTGLGLCCRKLGTRMPPSRH